MLTNNFDFDRPIYRQIIDRIYILILTGEWSEGEKMPAVRDFAITLQVNPNTVMRAYEALQLAHMIESRRGVGYFVCEGAAEQIRKYERETFINDELPRIFVKMDILQIPFEDVKKRHEQLKIIKI